MLTVGSLFSGIGGFDLGLERAGMRVIWQSEIDPYACAVLRKHWPDVPNHGDVRTIEAVRIERPDVLCGGFPCQDISNAGGQAGINGQRSGLWAEFARIIGELRPRFVIVENVAALLARGAGRVLGDLAALGFDAEWHCIPASAVGAPHRRDRIWIVAYPVGAGLEIGELHSGIYREAQRAQAGEVPALGSENQVTAWGCGLKNQVTAWEFEPDVGRVADGIPHRIHRLRGLGNAIVPQIAEIIGRAIVNAS